MLSIILPSYKGAEILKKHLPDFIRYLNQRGLAFEIIVVDDGSNDGGATQAAADENGCIYLANPRNLGKGAAVKKGMLSAKGDFRIFTDVDIPFHFSVMDQFFRYLDFKEFDVVIGDRTLPQSAYFKKIMPLRKIGTKVISRIIGIFIAGGLFDTQCGIKGFRAAVAEDLFSKSRIRRFAFDVEILYIALKRNYDIKRVPVQLRCNEGSTMKIFQEGLRLILDLLKIKWNYLHGFYDQRQEDQNKEVDSNFIKEKIEN